MGLRRNGDISDPPRKVGVGHGKVGIQASEMQFGQRCGWNPVVLVFYTGYRAVAGRHGGVTVVGGDGTVT